MTRWRTSHQYVISGVAHTRPCAHSHNDSYSSAHQLPSETPTFHRVLTECREPEGGRIELATYHRATNEAVRYQPAGLYDVLR